MRDSRDAMARLFQEGRDLEAREYTPEEASTLRSKAPAIIEAACREQHGENGSVFTPTYCLVCGGCPLATVLKGVVGVR